MTSVLIASGSLESWPRAVSTHSFGHRMWSHQWCSAKSTEHPLFVPLFIICAGVVQTVEGPCLQQGNSSVYTIEKVRQCILQISSSHRSLKKCWIHYCVSFLSLFVYSAMSNAARKWPSEEGLCRVMLAMIKQGYGCNAALRVQVQVPDLVSSG